MTVTRLGQLTAETGTIQEGVALGTPPALATDQVHTGLYSWRWSGTTQMGFGIPFPGVQQIVRASWFMRMGSLSDGGVVCTMRKTGGDYAFRLRGNGDVFRINNSTNIGNINWISSGASAGQWFACAFHAASGSDPDGLLVFYVNGTEVFRYMGDISPNMTSLLFGGPFSLTSGWTNNLWIDDAYADGLTPDEEVAAPPSRRFLPSRVISSFQSQWTVSGASTNVAAVDDFPGNDGDTTVVKTKVPGVEDLFAMTSVSLPADHVMRAVIPVAVTRRGDAALDATLRGVVFDGMNKVQGEAKLPGVSHRALWWRFPAQPDASAWTPGDYAMMKIGFKADGTFTET